VASAAQRGAYHDPRWADRGAEMPARFVGEHTLLPGTVSELQQLGISVREVALDRGFNVAATNTALADLQPKQTFIAGRQQPASKTRAAPAAALPNGRGEPGSATSNAAMGRTDHA
jgi:hypothetical protein